MSAETPSSPPSITRRASWRVRGANQGPPPVLSRAPPPVAQRHRRLPLQSGESDDKPQSAPLAHQARGASSVSSLVNSLNMSNNGSDHAPSSLSSLSNSTSRLGGYRLSSLDRLAQRQRLFEQTQTQVAPGGVATTTTTISNSTASNSVSSVLATSSISYTATPSSIAALQSKRDLFFKSESEKGSAASTAPAQAPASVTSPVTANGAAASVASSAATPATTSSSGAIASLKESLLASTKEVNTPPPAAVPASSTSKVEALKRELVEDNRERERVRERDKLAPAPPPPGGGSAEARRTREVDYVGFANLPNQVYRRAVKRGFEFTLMVVGESGLGKSTLINSMFLADIYSPEYPGPSHRMKKTVQVEQCKVLLKENGVNLTLNVVDTPGFGDAVDNSNCWQPVIDFVESKYEEYLNAESRVQRKQISDSRVHCCLYFIAPGHGLKPLDVEFMKRLHDKVNIIPVIAKADTMTPEECVHFKRQVLNEIAQNKIKIYEFPEPDEEELRKEQKALRERVPFAVVGSNAVVEIDGRKLRGRRYPWGIVEVENLEHCDFIPLRNMVIRTHMNDLKEVTNNVHYENYRCRKLAGVNTSDGKSNRISNKNPLAQMEEERKEHEAKMKKMEAEMEQVFEMKVKEKTQKLKDSEADLQRRHEQMRKSLEMQASELEEKRKALEAEREHWESTNGITLLELRKKDLEANSKEQVDGKEKTKKKKGLF